MNNENTKEVETNDVTASELKRLLYCNSCGYDTDELVEGYCRECAEEKQRELDEFNHRFDWWESLSDSEREAQIKNAL